METTKLVYCIDLDGTLCTNTYGKYKEAKPYQKRIEKINKLYDDHNTIIIWTARGVTTKKNWEELTIKQLKKWGVKYHMLTFEKIHFDVLLEDKAIELKKFFKE